jgi:excinuclease ABC subunit C
MLPQEIEEARIVSQWLRSKRGGEKVEFFVPKEGQPKELVQMATENATETLQALRAQWQADTHKQEQALTELQLALNLPLPPNRVECYDVSNTQGTAIVGAMVVFSQGVPDKKLYRKFNIESVVGAPDDFASMEEMLTRRFRRWRGATDEASPAPSPTPVLHPAGPHHYRWRQGQLGRERLEKFELPIKSQSWTCKTARNLLPHKSEPLMLPRIRRPISCAGESVTRLTVMGSLPIERSVKNSAWLHNWMPSPGLGPPVEKPS